MRRSLGASNVRLIRQVLIESCVLGLTGGVLGLLAGAWGSALLARMLPAGSMQMADVSTDARVLAFTAAVSILAALLFGLAPALQVAGTQPARTLRESGRGGVGTMRGNRVRSSLVVTGTSSVPMIGTHLPCTNDAVAVIYSTETGHLLWYHPTLYVLLE